MTEEKEKKVTELLKESIDVLGGNEEVNLCLIVNYKNIHRTSILSNLSQGNRARLLKHTLDRVMKKLLEQDREEFTRVLKWIVESNKIDPDENMKSPKGETIN